MTFKAHELLTAIYKAHEAGLLTLEQANLLADFNLSAQLKGLEFKLQQIWNNIKEAK